MNYAFRSAALSTCCCKCRREFKALGALSTHLLTCNGDANARRVYRRGICRRWVSRNQERHKVATARRNRRMREQVTDEYIRGLLRAEGLSRMMTAELIEAKRQFILSLRAIKEVKNVIRKAGEGTV